MQKIPKKYIYTYDADRNLCNSEAAVTSDSFRWLEETVKPIFLKETADEIGSRMIMSPVTAYKKKNSNNNNNERTSFPSFGFSCFGFNLQLKNHKTTKLNIRNFAMHFIDRATKRQMEIK